MEPVWKDKDIVISTSNPIEYEVILTDEDGAYDDTIYTGIATPKPSDNKVKIRINDFAKNVVNSDVQYEEGLFNKSYTLLGMNNYCKGVGVHYQDNNGGWHTDWDMFTNNYDYNELGSYNEEKVYLISNPITEYSNNGLTLITVFNNTREEVEVEMEGGDDGGYYMLTLNPYTAGVFQVELDKGRYSVYYNDEDIIKFNVIEGCNRYKLHYINAKGGYDTLPIEGKKDKRTDSFEFSYFKKRGNNQTISDYQMNKFQTNITPSWVLQTGWLNDEQSKKMYNLFGSHKVWLEDTEEDRIYPVYITDKNVTYKTYTNNGKKKISYSINVTSANTLVKL